MFELFNLTNILGQDPISFAQDQIQNNKMLVAFVAAMVIGSLMYVLKGIPSLLMKLFISKCTAVLTIHNSEVAYHDTISYLSKKGYIHSKVRRLEAVFVEDFPHNKPNPFDCENNMGLNLGLGHGYHVIFYKRNLFIIHHTINTESKMRDKPKSLTIRTIGRTNKKLKEFLNDVSDHAFSRDKDSIRAEIVSQFGDFTSLTPKRYRNTLILDSETDSDLFNDIDWFTKNRDWYINRGIPYKRGYLFYGPPGTGKTSLVKAVCTYLNSKIKIINLNSIMDDNELLKIFSSIESGSIVLLEDIDAINLDINERNTNNVPKLKKPNKTLSDGSEPLQEDPVEKRKDEQESVSSGVTLSGVLNALDGVTNSDSVITIMTTNYPEKIDTAILRPGRVDKKVYIGYPNYESCQRFFDLFYTEYDDEKLRDDFATACVENELSPADIQEVCIENISNPHKAVEKIKNKIDKNLHSINYSKQSLKNN